MKQSKDLQDIVETIKGNNVGGDCLVDTPKERLAAYKIIKSFARLSLPARQALVPSMKSIAGNSSSIYRA